MPQKRYDIRYMRRSSKAFGTPAGHVNRVRPAGFKWGSGDTSGKLAVWRNVELSDDDLAAIADRKFCVDIGGGRGIEHKLKPSDQKHWLNSIVNDHPGGEPDPKPKPKKKAKANKKATAAKAKARVKK